MDIDHNQHSSLSAGLQRVFRVFLAAVIVVGAASAAFACFFISDCPPGYKCVTEQGQWDGKCEEVKEEQLTNSTVKPPDLDMPCAYNTDCKPGFICLRVPGTPNGLCKQDQAAEDALVTSKNKPCTFPSDCKAGWQCVKQGNSPTGYCKEEFFGSTDNTSLNPRFQHTSEMKKCLVSGDCGIREVCVQPVGSVFGYCEDKNVAASSQTAVQTNTQVPTTTNSDGFYVPNLF